VLEHYHKLKEDEIVRLIDINCTATSLMCRLLLPGMQKRRMRSAIINVASLAGNSSMTQDKSL
jgi:NADP-dependent 3-hydroxy acid dehydrogenase YdfG